MKLTVNSTVKLIRMIPYLLMGFFILFFLNGMSTHPIKEADLENTFLEKVASSNLEAGKMLKSDVYENSKTFLFKNDKGEIACASYSKSIYSAKWREEKFYTSNMSVFNNNEITYEINDKRFIYPITCRINDEPIIKYGEHVSVVLSVKVFGICVILMAGFVGRFVGMKRHRR